MVKKARANQSHKQISLQEHFSHNNNENNEEKQKSVKKERFSSNKIFKQKSNLLNNYKYLQKDN